MGIMRIIVLFTDMKFNPLGNKLKKKFFADQFQKIWIWFPVEIII